MHPYLTKNKLIKLSSALMLICIFYQQLLQLSENQEYTVQFVPQLVIFVKIQNLETKHVFILTGMGCGSFKCGLSSVKTSGRNSGTSYGCDDTKAHSPNTPACRFLIALLFS